MNTIYLKDCIVCHRFFATNTTSQHKTPTISQFVPVTSRIKSAWTCSNECANIRHNNAYKYKYKLEFQVNIQINHRVLRSKKLFLQFIEDNAIPKQSEMAKLEKTSSTIKCIICGNAMMNSRHKNEKGDYCHCKCKK